MLNLTQQEYDKIRKNLAKNKTNQGKTLLSESSKQGDSNSKKVLKYRNVHMYVYKDGYVSSSSNENKHGKLIFHFDSKKEYTRWEELKVLERIGKIQDLRLQQPLIIQDKFVTNYGEKVSAINYKADFMYLQDGITVIEDVKGIDKKTGKAKSTEAFKLKWKMLKVKYPEYIFKIV